MGKLLEAFKMLCTDFDHILEKKGGKLFKGDTLQGKILIKVIRYLSEIYTFKCSNLGNKAILPMKKNKLLIYFLIIQLRLSVKLD